MVEHKRFRTLNFSTRERSAYAEMVNAIYQAQVVAAEAEEMIQRSRKFNKKEEVTPAELEATIKYFQESYSRFCAEVAGHPVLCFLGSARDAAVSSYGVRLHRALSKLSVARSLGISSGDWYYGYMGVPKYFWLKEKQGHDLGWAFSTAVALGGQEVTAKQTKSLPIPDWFRKVSAEDGLDAEHEWKRFTEEWREERRSPPHMSFLSRTTSIYFPGQAVGKAYCVPGKGTNEEYTRFSLSRQMAPRNLTADSWRPPSAIPWDFLLDEPIEPDEYSEQQGWVYDFRVQEMLMQIRKGTVDVAEFEGLAFIRVVTEEPTEQAPRFFEQRWIDSEEALEAVLEHSRESKGNKQPYMLYFSSFELAAEFVVERCYLTHRRLAEAVAEHVLAENGDAASGLQ